MKKIMLFFCVLGSSAWLSAMEITSKTLFSVDKFHIKKLYIKSESIGLPSFKMNGARLLVGGNSNEKQQMFCAITGEKIKNAGGLAYARFHKNYHTSIASTFMFMHLKPHVVTITDNPLQLICLLVPYHNCYGMYDSEQCCRCLNQEKLLCVATATGSEENLLLSPTDIIARSKGKTQYLNIGFNSYYNREDPVVKIAFARDTYDNILLLKLTPNSNHTQDRMNKLRQAFPSIYFNFK